ncbi:MAG: hypothetical protein JWN70_5564 [Planctomycetaceae bacterium]|nr:hypothetical protein [Planctomycetaceae bacterium]
MLYKFPPPEWFEDGTTSRLVLIIAFWALIIGIPAGLLGLRIVKLQSRVIWVVAETLWIIASIILAVRSDDFLGMTFLLVLLFVPFHVGVAVINAVVNGFSSPADFFGHPWLEWGCATLVAFISVNFALLPYYSTPRESGRRSQCKNNLKQIGLALHNYLDEFTKFPDIQIRSEDSEPMSWRVGMLPYLDRKADFANYVPTATWDSDDNFLISKAEVGQYLCPSVPVTNQKDRAGRWYSAYATLVGPQTAFAAGKGRAIPEFTDGTSNTVLVVEACGQQIVWTEPRDIELTDKNLGINQPGNKAGQSNGSWSSFHRDGAHTLMGDGAVRFLSATTDPRVLRAITTANGGEEVGNY